MSKTLELTEIRWERYPAVFEDRLGRQWLGVHSPRGPTLAEGAERQYALHRARQPLAEWLWREFQQLTAGV
jgi:hypothetical protein